MEDETNEAKQLRLRAKELRTLSDQAENLTTHDVYLDLASTCDLLAQQTEERAQRQQLRVANANRQDLAGLEAQSVKSVMHEHRFKVGQTVHFEPPMAGIFVSPGLFRIVHLLPIEGAENQYWIKSIVDGDEQFADESHLHSFDGDISSDRKKKR